MVVGTKKELKQQIKKASVLNKHYYTTPKRGFNIKQTARKSTASFNNYYGSQLVSKRDKAMLSSNQMDNSDEPPDMTNLTIQDNSNSDDNDHDEHNNHMAHYHPRCLTCLYCNHPLRCLNCNEI